MNSSSVRPGSGSLGGRQRADRHKADAAYETAVAALRERTRDPDELPLVFDEVCNLWGHRRLGIVLALAGAVIASGAAVLGAADVAQISVPASVAIA